MTSIHSDAKMSTNQSLLQKTGKTQAAFVPKLYIMVKDMRQPTPEDPNPERPLISWSKTGDVFCVFNPVEFSRVILPLHFKHNNWQSFVRQLNMYGFHKVNDLLSSSHCHPETTQAWEFRHPHFKRDRPDLLPMIKRKSTKHHGSPKTGNVHGKALGLSQPGETRFQPRLPTSDSPSARNYRSFQNCTPHNHPNSALMLAHRPLHGKPPPPPPVQVGKTNPLPHLPPRPSALYPIHTHQLQHHSILHPQGKSYSPSSKNASMKASSCSTATTNTSNNSLTSSSPRSARPSAHNFHHIHSQPGQPICRNVYQEGLSQRSLVDSWRNKPEPHRTDLALSRIEDELRRLNDRLSHHDLIGNHVFSVLGLLVELITFLAGSHEDQNGAEQKQPLSHYVQAVKNAMAKLETSNHEPHDAGRKSSAVPSTDSMSPVSADLTERPPFQYAQAHANSADSKTIDQSVSPTHAFRPRCPDHLASTQSLPPLRTIVENWTPPILNINHSSGALPASINRLMNVDLHGHSSAEMSSASEEDPHEEHVNDDDHEDDAGEEDYDNNQDDDDDELQDDEESEEDEAEGADSDDSEHQGARGESTDGQQSASYHLSDTSESPPENTPREENAGRLQSGHPSARPDLRSAKRPSAQLRSILLPPDESAEKISLRGGVHTSWKRTRIA